MEAWYKVATPRKEVREGRSFNPDEFAIHLEQVIAKTAPEDYREPEQFFARTCFTRALREHAGMVLRRLSGETANTAPVMTLITQFGAGKTHTLTALYHLVTNGAKAIDYQGIGNLIKEAGISTVPQARVATTILFESSGGQIDKVAHLPELRFALGEPDVDTTSVDNAAFALEDKSYRSLTVNPI